MALKAQTRKQLANAMSTKALATDLENVLISKAGLSAKQQRNLAFALADRKAKDDVKASAKVHGRKLLVRTKAVILDMMIRKAEANDLIALIES